MKITSRPNSGDGIRVGNPVAAVRSAVTWVVERTSLTVRFMLLALLILVVGAVVIGRFVSAEIEDRVLHRTSATTALYVDSVITPHLQALQDSHDISVESRAELDRLMIESDLGQQIASFKVWHTDGEIVYAKDHALIGRQFPIAEDLEKALTGEIAIERSDLTDEENAIEALSYDKLIEIYAPVRETGSSRIIGAMEIYEDPASLNAEIADSRRNGWLIVGGATAVMYALLVGMVGGASRTINSQQRRVQSLAVENAALADRVKQAAARKAETDELLLTRVAQDLHDGPAQDISLALLRVDKLGEGKQRDDGDVDLTRAALQAALRDIRQVTSGLRMPEIEGLSLGEVIKKAASNHEEKTTDRVRVALCRAIPTVDVATRIAFYRVTQEALNNASKHSGVSEMDVRLGSEAGNIVLEVADSGSGLNDPSDSMATGESHLGVRGMKERMEMLGGSLEVSAGPNGGTIVRATLPRGKDTGSE